MKVKGGIVGSSGKLYCDIKMIGVSRKYEFAMAVIKKLGPFVRE